MAQIFSPRANVHSRVIQLGVVVLVCGGGWATSAIFWSPYTTYADLPDFTYVDHSIRVADGVGCATCHGEVDRMPLTWRSQTLYMKWCLESHRAPENFVRPRSEIYNLHWQPPPNQPEQGLRLVRQ